MHKIILTVTNGHVGCPEEELADTDDRQQSVDTHNKIIITITNGGAIIIILYL